MGLKIENSGNNRLIHLILSTIKLFTPNKDGGRLIVDDYIVWGHNIKVIGVIRVRWSWFVSFCIRVS